MAKKITSESNPLIRHVLRLQKESAYRKEAKECVVSGIKRVAEIQHPRLLLVVDEALVPKKFQGEVYVVTEALLKLATGLKTPEGIAAVVPLKSHPLPKKISRLLALDGVQDPGNVGTLIRSSYAFGWDALFVLPGTADPWGDKALRAASGATFKLPIIEGDFEALKKMIKQHALTPYAADMKGASFETVTQEPLLLILGSEGQGVSTEASFAKKVSVPMENAMESLNVGVAGGILLYGLKHAPS